VLDSVTSPESKRAYGKGIADFVNWHSATIPGSALTKSAVQGYRAHLISLGLSASTINVRMSAVRRLAGEAADNGLMRAELAAGIGR
jgi:site-specific recombinase XerD